MALTLAQYQARIANMLSDPAYALWNTAEHIDAGLRMALEEYNNANPQMTETVITLPGDGREIALNALTGLITVTEVWWPYDSTADEVYPPNRVMFRLWWDNAQPVLYLPVPNQPQQDDELRIWYTLRHTIQDLDSEAVTTIPPDDETLLILGASGHTALTRQIDLADNATIDVYHVELLRDWGQQRLDEFRAGLAAIRRRQTRVGPPFGPGWQIDKWDKQGSWDEQE